MNNRYWLLSGKKEISNFVGFYLRVYNADLSVQPTTGGMEIWNVGATTVVFDSMRDLQAQAAGDRDELLLLWTHYYPNGIAPCANIDNTGSCVVLQRFRVDTTANTTTAMPAESPSEEERDPNSSQSMAPTMAQRDDGGLVAWLTAEMTQVELRWRAWSWVEDEVQWGGLERLPLSIPDATLRPAVARRGDGYLLLWDERNPGEGSRSLKAQALSADGVAVDAPAVLDTALSMHSVRAITQEDGSLAILYVKDNLLHYIRLTSDQALGLSEPQILSSRISPSAGAFWAAPTAGGGLVVSASGQEDQEGAQPPYSLQTSLLNAEGAWMCIDAP
jgi:hypothetical protein